MARPPIASSSVCLKEITATTVRAVTNLVVSPEQERYVASNAVSIAQAYFHREAWFRAVYAAGEPVGFLMLRDFSLLRRTKASPDPAPPISLWRLMIDRHHQRRGLGRQALALVVEHARTRPGATALHTSYVEGPHAAGAFYLSFGFRPTGTSRANGEIDLILDLGAL